MKYDCEEIFFPFGIMSPDCELLSLVLGLEQLLDRRRSRKRSSNMGGGYASRGRTLTEVIFAVVFVGFLTGFVLVLCFGNYFRARRAAERQRQRRLANKLVRHANHVVVLGGGTEGDGELTGAGAGARGQQQQQQQLFGAEMSPQSSASSSGGGGGGIGLDRRYDAYTSQERTRLLPNVNHQLHYPDLPRRRGLHSNGLLLPRDEEGDPPVQQQRQQRGGEGGAGLHSHTADLMSV
jgi:type II secretory pathway pseudopilin PulG